MKKSFWKILLVLTLLLMLGQASADVLKDEVVWGRLSGEGKVEEVFIVNYFESDKSEQVVDRGDYSQITALSEGAAPQYADGAVRFDMQPGRYYYQGQTSKLDLPWHIRIAYELDGKKKDPAELSGAAGALRMVISVRVNPRLAQYAATAAMQITVTLEAARASAIQAPKATMAWAGDKRQLTFVVLPGMEADYEITCAVQDFAMAPIQLGGTRLQMDSEMYKQAAQKQLEGSPLAQAAGGIMDNFLQNMQGAPSPSFADVKNPQVQSVQFVLLTPEITPQAAPVATPTPASQATEKSFIKRLTKLFGL